MLVELRFSYARYGDVRVDFFFDGNHEGFVMLGSAKGDVVGIVTQWALSKSELVNVSPNWIFYEGRSNFLFLTVRIDDEKAEKLRALVSIPGKKTRFWRRLLDKLETYPVEKALEEATTDIFVQKL